MTWEVKTAGLGRSLSGKGSFVVFGRENGHGVDGYFGEKTKTNGNGGRAVDE